MLTICTLPQKIWISWQEAASKLFKDDTGLNRQAGICLVVYLIIDLDRPRRGAIQVNHESMLSLQQDIEAAQGHAAQPGSQPGAAR